MNCARALPLAVYDKFKTSTKTTSIFLSSVLLLVSFVVLIATWSSYINPILVSDLTFNMDNRVESIDMWSVTGYISCFLATVSFFLVVLLLLSDLLFYFHRREKALAALYVFLSAPLVLATHFGVLFGYGDYKSTEYMGNPNVESNRSFTLAYYGSGLFGPQFIYFLGFLVLHGVSIGSMLHHYYFASTLDGPTLSDFFNTWKRKFIGYIKYTRDIAPTFLSRSTIVLVRLEGQEDFKRIPLSSKTITALEEALVENFPEFQGHEIKRVVKDGDTLIEDDSDMGAIERGACLTIQVGEVIYLDTQEGSQDGMFSEDGMMLDIPMSNEEIDPNDSHSHHIDEPL